MWSNARHIAPGDVVIAWLTRDIVQPLVVTPGKDFNSRYGSYRHSDLIGLPFGSKVGSSNGKGFIHILRPTPELWTLALPHRTQILYLADIAFITSWLNLRPGSHVIEAARTVGPTGKVWSYEFHEQRANKAREEFARHGMAEVVTLTHRNVCKDGFTVTDEVNADLPAPWEAVEHAKVALRASPGLHQRMIAPCMEQVLRTVSALNDAGFTDITMYETLLRPHEVSQVPAPLPVGAIAEKLKQSEAKREEKRLRQIENARGRQTDKRKRDDSSRETPGEVEPKRVKVEGEDTADDAVYPGASEDVVVPVPAEVAAPAILPALQDVQDVSMEPAEVTSQAPSKPTMPAPPATQVVSKILPEVRGHTSYLTFARLPPAIPAKTTGDESQPAGSTQMPDAKPNLKEQL
ncbi:hypothetical protein EWM64_g817 [Hericium alpestre]|uniref:tRNA (adenine(58)-N(1))-methyltransferase catalytic subunit TRM61 n=1 Tax=Hericium alpestre TaxID=135208 RepID=A0A4Z0AA35_9AGAM|nr:hypothetical protein EWM64_g817 [Hericium alpestre]